MKKIPVGILGVSGYTGLELIKLLLSHPRFEIAYLGGSNQEESIANLHPSLLDIANFEVQISDCAKIASMCEIVFLALPHKSAMEFAKKLLNSKVKVIDLSADYRLSLENYEKNYCTHLDSDNLQHAVYGLPEYNEECIKTASLVANPGCYPTATLLAILPFIPWIEGSIFVDAKSGVSGAGKTPTATSHYSRINENIFAYSPLEHRHQIEIEEKISFFSNKEIQVNFIPHLCPFTRGMLVSVYARLKTNLNPLEILKNHYQNHPFIRIRQTPPEVKNVSGTHFCDLFAKVLGNDLFVSSAIDNLLRGASSQALMNANLLSNLPFDLGIPKIAYVP